MDVEKYRLFLKIFEEGVSAKDLVVEMDIEKWNMMLRMKDRVQYDFSDYYAPSRVINELKTFAPPSIFPRLLCLGCGSGYEVEYAIKQGYKAVGITLGKKNVEKARSRGLDVRYGDMHDLQFPPDSFDVVLSNHSFEHSFCGWMVAIEVYAVLRDYGRWLVELPNQHVQSKTDPFNIAFDLNHMSLLIPSEMQRIFLHTGFKNALPPKTDERYTFYLEKVPLQNLPEELGEQTSGKILWVIPLLMERLEYGKKKYTENYQWQEPLKEGF